MKAQRLTPMILALVIIIGTVAIFIFDKQYGNEGLERLTESGTLTKATEADITALIEAMYAHMEEEPRYRAGKIEIFASEELNNTYIIKGGFSLPKGAKAEFITQGGAFIPEGDLSENAIFDSLSGKCVAGDRCRRLTER